MVKVATCENLLISDAWKNGRQQKLVLCKESEKGLPSSVEAIET